MSKKQDEGFAGFPDGRLVYTPLPNLFFSGLLPQIDNLAELKVTLHIFWLLYQKKGWPRCISLRQLLADTTLMRGLRAVGVLGRTGTDDHAVDAVGAEAALYEGLQLAIQRGTLLHLMVDFADRQENLYFLHTANSRDVIARLRRGDLDLDQLAVSIGTAGTLEAAAEIRVERPNIFTLYEQNVGLLTPLLVEELRDAERLYPPAWIEEAFRIAVEYNKRNWKYIQRILERWRSEGRMTSGYRDGSGNAPTGPRRLVDISDANMSDQRKQEQERVNEEGNYARTDEWIQRQPTRSETARRSARRDGAPAFIPNKPHRS